MSIIATCPFPFLPGTDVKEFNNFLNGAKENSLYFNALSFPLDGREVWLLGLPRGEGKTI